MDTPATPDFSAAPLALHLFGPFEASVNGAPLPRLRSLKGQWLLALLALHANQEVERAWLTTLLWPDSAERAAFANLRCSLKDLRRALGHESARLRSPTTGTLCLDLTGAGYPCNGWIDALAFDAAITRGDAASLREAVALYRGPLLERCAEEWVFLERRAREEAYLGALEALATEALAAGEPGEAAGWLRRAVGVDPLRETAQRSLMQALAASGNYGAALLVYRELRQRLHREINAEPDAETQAVFAMIRLEARAKAGARGHRPGASRVTSDLPADFPPLNALDARSHNLPAQATALLGRKKEVAAVQQLLRQEAVRLVTLTGPGGTGKTRLALQVAADLLDLFAAGVCFVALAPISDPSLVPSAIAQTLGVRETSGMPLMEGLKAYLKEKQLLLLLDNFEQVLEAAPLVSELLAAAPRVKVLVTSRSVLRLRGEKEFAVPPLGLPDPKRLPALEALTQYGAVELFIQRALDYKADFAVTNENAPAVAVICHRLDGLPLAIELAAARIKLFSPQALLSRLERGLPLLTGGARDLPARQQTLRGAVAWSYDLLDEGEKTLFRRLSVFLGGCTLEAAEAVCDAEGDLEIGVLDGLAALVDNSLLRQEEQADGEPRFTMLETIREYGTECLMVAGEAEAVRWRHAQCMLALAEEVRKKIHGPEQEGWLERLEQEHDNMRAALAWCIEAGVQAFRRSGAQDRYEQPDFDSAGPECLNARTPEHLTMGLRLAEALWEFWHTRGYWDEGRQWLEQALAAAPATEPSAERARALAAAGRLATHQWDIAAARERLEESITLYRLLGDTRGLVEALTHRALALKLREGNPAAARVLQVEAVALARTLGDPRLLALALCELGGVTADRVVLEESLALARRVGDQRLMILFLESLGDVSLRLGDGAKARAFLEDGVALARAANKKVPLCNALLILANVLSQQGDRERAKSLREECLRLARELRLPLLIGRAMGALAAHDPSSAEALRMIEQAVGESGPEAVQYALGYLVTAAPSYKEALRVVEHAAAEYGPPVIRWALRPLARRAPSHEEALRWIEQAARDYGPDVAIPELGAQGHAAREQGDYEWAATCYRRSLALRQEVGDPFVIAQMLEDFGGLAARQQQWERAATLLGAAEGACVARGWTPPAGAPEEYERAVRGARDALGEEVFTAMWAAGRALSLEDAIQYALGGSDA